MDLIILNIKVAFWARGTEEMVLDMNVGKSNVKDF